MAIEAAILADRSLIEVSGDSARDFLQGLVTVDVEDVHDGVARHGALLTPQGKILFEFVIHPHEQSSFLLDVGGEFAAELAKRLVFYRLRVKVDIAPREDLAVAAIWGDDDRPDVASAVRDPRLPAMGWRAVLPDMEADTILKSAGASIVGDDAYQAHRITHGIAELGHDYSSGGVFPHEADLDQLAGVDFDKGCFVGQEVVSRMQHRGTARKRFVPAQLDGTPPPPGTDVVAGGINLGVTGSAAAGHALALVRLDRLADALNADAPIMAAGAKLTPMRPEWAAFDWPGVPAS